MSRTVAWRAGGFALAPILIGSALLMCCSSPETADPAGTGGVQTGGGSGGSAGQAAGSGVGGTARGGSAGTGSGSGGVAGNGGAAGASASSGLGGMSAGGVGGESSAGAGGGGGTLGGLGGMSGGAGAPGGAGGATGGDGGRGGAAGQDGGRGGSAGAATGPFVCNQAHGGKLISELYNAGLEMGLDGARWQLKWRDSASIEEWANAESAFWSAPIESACTNGSDNPDRIVFMIFSWTVKTQADWRTKITQAVNNLRAKYSNLRRVDFMNQILGPNNMLCPTPPAANETIVASPELRAAMQEVADAFPGFVFLSPMWEARSCSDFQGGGPHLTTAGNQAAAPAIATYFAATQ